MTCMAKGQYHISIDPAIRDAFKEKCKSEGRHCAPVLEKLMQFYTTGKLNIWKDK